MRPIHRDWTYEGRALKMEFERENQALISRAIVIALAFFLYYTSGSYATDSVKQAEQDRCAVCGMFVSKHPNWIAKVVYSDGSAAVFDGPKDLFKYYFNPAQYAPQQKASIVKVLVNDYYRLRPIDGRAAWYVAGSDVFGPMGRELIPFEKKTDAKEFMNDHKGTSLFRFIDITPGTLKSLD